MALIPPVTQHDHAAGAANAPLTLVEYGDYQCPYCAAAEPVVRELRSAFGADLRWVFRNFPLTEVHPAAEPAAESAEAAGARGMFWAANHALFAHNRRFGPASLGLGAFAKIAERLGLDARDMEDAIRQHRFLGRIRNDFTSGVRSGVHGTPTFFINGARYDGPPTVEELGAALAAAR